MMKPSAPVPFGFAFDRLVWGILQSNPARRPFGSAILAFRDEPFKARLARCWNSLGPLPRCAWEDVVLLVYDADPIAAGGGGHTDLRVTIIRIAPAPALEQTVRSGDLAEDPATGQIAA
jgi:hypothetical protein